MRVGLRTTEEGVHAIDQPIADGMLQVLRLLVNFVPLEVERLSEEKLDQPMPPDDPRVRCPDITRAKQILGWTPVISRKEGLGKMIDFYRDQLIKK